MPRGAGFRERRPGGGRAFASARAVLSNETMRFVSSAVAVVLVGVACVAACAPPDDPTISDPGGIVGRQTPNPPGVATAPPADPDAGGAAVACNAADYPTGDDPACTVTWDQV